MFGLESWEYGRRDPSRWPHSTLYPLKLALTSPTSGGRSVGIVRSRTQATEFGFNKYVEQITFSRSTFVYGRNTKTVQQILVTCEGLLDIYTKIAETLQILLKSDTILVRLCVGFEHNF
jgi:hypothetical protein